MAWQECVSISSFPKSWSTIIKRDALRFFQEFEITSALVDSIGLADITSGSSTQYAALAPDINCDALFYGIATGALDRFSY